MQIKTDYYSDTYGDSEQYVLTNNTLEEATTKFNYEPTTSIRNNRNDNIFLIIFYSCQSK